ncbi:MAG: TolC family protein [Filifactoraceae bacterium]
MKKLACTLIVAIIVTSQSSYAIESKKMLEYESKSKEIQNTLNIEKKISIEDAMSLAEIKVTKDPLYTEKLKALEKIQGDMIYKYGEPKRKTDNLGNVYYEYPNGDPSFNLTKEIMDIEEKLKDDIKSKKDKVKSLYFSIIDEKQNLQIESVNFELATLEFEKANFMYSRGTITKTEVSAKEGNKTTAKANLDRAKTKLSSLYKQIDILTDLSKLYGINPENIIFDISSKLNYASTNIVGSYVVPSNLIDVVQEKDKVIGDLKKELKDKEETLKRVTKNYSEDSKYYYDKYEELEIKILKDKIDDLEHGLKVDFIGESQKLTDSINGFQSVVATFKLSEKKYHQATLKYNSGQIKKIDYLREKLKYDEEKQSYDKKLKDIYVYVDSYNQKYNLNKKE